MDTERFARILDVLDLPVGAPEGLRLTEISQPLGTSVGSTHNLLQTMPAAQVLDVRGRRHPRPWCPSAEDAATSRPRGCR